jgi:hypothetical protein
MNSDAGPQNYQRNPDEHLYGAALTTKQPIAPTLAIKIPASAAAAMCEILN